MILMKGKFKPLSNIAQVIQIIIINLLLTAFSQNVGTVWHQAEWEVVLFSIFSFLGNSDLSKTIRIYVVRKKAK